jgi:hypothetical protein
VAKGDKSFKKGVEQPTHAKITTVSLQVFVLNQSKLKNTQHENEIVKSLGRQWRYFCSRQPCGTILKTSKIFHASLNYFFTLLTTHLGGRLFSL